MIRIAKAFQISSDLRVLADELNGAGLAKIASIIGRLAGDHDEATFNMLKNQIAKRLANLGALDDEYRKEFAKYFRDSHIQIKMLPSLLPIKEGEDKKAQIERSKRFKEQCKDKITAGISEIQNFVEDLLAKNKQMPAETKSKMDELKKVLESLFKLASAGSVEDLRTLNVNAKAASRTARRRVAQKLMKIIFDLM